MRTLIFILWGALLLAPAYSQERLRSLASTGTVEEIRDAIRFSAELTRPDATGVTALMLAAANNHDPQIITMLVAAGAAVETRSRTGETPLIYAAECNPNPEVVLALLRAGANIEDRDGLGRTPLMAAAWGNPNPDVILALLKAGADVRAKSYDRRIAYDWLRENGRLASNSDIRQALAKGLE